MKVLILFKTSLKKYFKGMLALTTIWLFLGATIFVFDSCQRVGGEPKRLSSAANQFNLSVKAFRDNIGNLKFNKINIAQSRTNGGEDLYYIDFPEGTNPNVITDFESNINLQTLTNVLVSYGVSIDDSLNIDAEVVAHIPEAPIREALNPLVQEAKNYLYSKGITDQQINELLVEENAEEIDLIPFVKHLIAIEEEHISAKNIFTPLPFVSQANALPRFVECGMAALGVTAINYLLSAEPTSWTWSLMKPAFKKVAQRMLGPIGVAIAVLSFTTCMLGLGS